MPKLSCVGLTHFWAHFNCTSEGALLYEEFSIASHPVPYCILHDLSGKQSFQVRFRSSRLTGHFRHLLGLALAIPDSVQGHSGVFQPQHGPAHLA